MKKNTREKIFALLLACAMVLTLLAACGQESGNAGGAENNSGNSQAADDNTQSPDDSTQPSDDNAQPPEGSGTNLGVKYAINFEIDYLDNGVKLVTDADGIAHLLVPREAEIPEGYDSVSVIRTPVERVMYCSTTDVGLLKALGVDSIYDSIAAVTTDVYDWTIPQVIERMESGQIAYIAQPWDQPAPNIEEVAELNPGLVVLYSGELSLTMGPQLDELGIPYVVENLAVEETDEGLMEWMKFFAALYNEDERADGIFEANVARMSELRAAAAEIPAEERPVVAYGLNYDGTVYTATAQSRIAQMIEDVGGVYALSDLEGVGDVQITLEEFVDKARDADILIYSSLVQYLPDKVALLEDAAYGDPMMEEFKAYANDTIYVYGMDYYMSSAEVCEKLEDWMAMVHPELMEGYELKHFVKLPDTAE